MNDIIVVPPAPSTPPESPAPVQPSAPESRFRQWLKRHWKWLSFVVALVLIGSATYAWAILRPLPEPKTISVTKATPRPTPTPTPLTKASPLTGAQVEPAAADRPVRSIIIENSPDARPQSGLQDAGVVYEALAEGGITRFQTFFLEGQPATLGPVRSLRAYFVDWGLEFNAPVAHAGGSAEALDLVGPTGLRSLNALVIGAPSFYRTNDRAAPHNLYTNSTLLDKLLAARGITAPASFKPTPRKADSPAQTAANPNITINYSSGAFTAAYRYDAAANDYARLLAGVPHIDRNSGKQIHVKNIVVEYMPTRILDSAGHVGMTTVGRGQGIVFRDGQAIAATWVKESRNARTKLLDTNGNEIPLNVGNTWYSIVPVGRTVSY